MEAYISELIPCLIEGEEESAIAVVKKASADGIDAIGILQGIVVPSMTEIGDQFAKMEIFLPELALAADVAKVIKEELADELKAKASGIDKKGKVVIGTVQGDVHDLGKNMVATILEVYGFEVFDLGNDVAVFDFINAADREQADIIALSSLLTTSMPYMEEVIESLVALGKREKYKVVVGGGPVSKEYAERIGADGYSHDATGASALCESLLAK